MIQREDQGDVAVLRMEHGKVQALDLELVVALEQALDRVEQDGVAAVVLTGTGSSFSAGVDLFRLLGQGTGYAAEFLAALGSALRRLFFFPRPVVAAVNGHAIAGGLILVCACDLRVAARGGGRLGAPELLVGLPFPAPALEILRFALPCERLQRTLYRGGRVSFEEAFEAGLLDELYEPERLQARSLERAQELAALPSDAFALAKRQLRLPALELLDRHGPALDAAVLSQWTDATTGERIRAYLEQTVGKAR